MSMSRRREKVIHEAWAAAFNTWWNVLDSELYFFFITLHFGLAAAFCFWQSCVQYLRCNLLSTSWTEEHIPHLWYGFDFSVFIIPAAAAAAARNAVWEAAYNCMLFLICCTCNLRLRPERASLGYAGQLNLWMRRVKSSIVIYFET